MTKKRPSVQVTHSAICVLRFRTLPALRAAFLPALPRGDGVVFAPLRPHLLRPRKVLRRGDYAHGGEVFDYGNGEWVVTAGGGEEIARWELA